MKFWLLSGFERARALPRLTMATYLAALVPALLFLLLAAPKLFGALADRPAAAGLLDTRAFDVWIELVQSEGFSAGALFAPVPWLLLCGWLLQVAVAAGSVQVLVAAAGAEPPGSHPFTLGVRRYFGRFLRSSAAFGLAVAGLLLVLAILGKVFGKIGDSVRDERWGLWGFAVQLLVGLAVFIPLDLAYDLSRVSAVRHDGRQVFRGFFRALPEVWRRRRQLYPLYLGCLALLLALTLVFVGVRGLFSASTAVGIVAVALVQQAFSFGRSFLQVGLWGAEVAAFGAFGQPDWCRPEAPAIAAAVPVSPEHGGVDEAVAGEANEETEPPATTLPSS